jgi:hypothetical protein
MVKRELARTSAAALTGSLVAFAGASAGCAHADPTIDDVRFENAEPVWVVDDRRDVPKPPEESEFYRNFYFFEELVVQPTERTLSLERFPPAQNVNALGEVPDSTWFTNRIGRHDLSAAEVRRGPKRDGPPDLSEPLRVHEAEWGAGAPRLVVEDARGLRYVLKFDQAGIPENETAADVIVQRILWASGFHVPEDDIVFFSRAQLELAEGAVRVRELGGDLPLAPEDLDVALADVERAPDGRFRGLSSRYLPGKPLGGYDVRGTRSGDPNDVVPHELRRELRGQHVFFAWVDHTDVKPDNWLDVWVERPPGSGRHYVEHYLLDFGKALGNLAWIDRYPEDGFAYFFDLGYAGPSLLSLGLYRRPWDGYRVPELRGVGRFGISAFDPAAWKPYYPFLPVTIRDAVDDYWAAKIVMRFTPAHIRAAVAAGRLSSPLSRAYLAEMLQRRQRAIGRWAFSRVPPFDDFAFEPGPGGSRLCFSSLWERYDFDAETGTVLRPTRATAFDFDAHPLGERALARVRLDRWCTEPLPTGDARDGYTIVVLEAELDGRALPTVHVHVARAPDTGRWRVIGIDRSSRACSPRSSRACSPRSSRACFPRSS